MTRVTLLFLSITSLSYGQKIEPLKIKIKKEISDTIDYSSFQFGIKNQYLLKRVRQFKGQDIYDMRGRQLFFDLAKDTGSIKQGTSILKIGKNDTLIYLWWDVDTKQVHDQVNHIAGILRLDQVRNILFCN